MKNNGLVGLTLAHLLLLCCGNARYFIFQFKMLHICTQMQFALKYVFFSPPLCLSCSAFSYSLYLCAISLIILMLMIMCGRFEEMPYDDDEGSGS